MQAHGAGAASRLLSKTQRRGTGAENDKPVGSQVSSHFREMPLMIDTASPYLTQAQLGTSKRKSTDALDMLHEVRFEKANEGRLICVLMYDLSVQPQPGTPRPTFVDEGPIASVRPALAPVGGSSMSRRRQPAACAGASAVLTAVPPSAAPDTFGAAVASGSGAGAAAAANHDEQLAEDMPMGLQMSRGAQSIEHKRLAK